MSAAVVSLGKAMYVASEDDRLWLRTVQRALYARSQEHPDYVFEKLWGLVTDPHNLRIALDRVHRNRGARSAGIDRVAPSESPLAARDTRFAGLVVHAGGDRESASCSSLFSGALSVIHLAARS